MRPEAEHVAAALAARHGARGGGARSTRQWRGHIGDGLGGPRMGLPGFFFFLFKFFLLTEAGSKTASVNVGLTVTVVPRRLQKLPRLMLFARLGKCFLY